VASVAELGYQGFDVVSWIGLAGPAALPNDIVNKIGSDVLKVIQQPDARDRILATGVEIVPAPADEFAAYVVKEHAKWAKVVKDSGAKLD